VCCTGNGGTCQAQSACGMRGNRQICTMSSECPTAYPDCVIGGGGGTGTCRVAPDAAAPPADAASDVATGG
jgi:hypothetical protein